VQRGLTSIFVIAVFIQGALWADQLLAVAGLGIGGIAIALAAQNVLADLFASIAIVLDRPFGVGDFITFGGERGTVERIGIKTTRIRSLSGEQISCPNTDLLNARVHNFKRMSERRWSSPSERPTTRPMKVLNASRPCSRRS
jgi:small-conductance mechanosensitive channel